MLSIRVAESSTEYDLPVLPRAEQERLQTWYDNGEWDNIVSPLQNCQTPKDPEYKVGSLFWPMVGASRFAHAVLPVDYYTLGLIRDAIGGGIVVDEDLGEVTDENDDPVTAEGNNRVTLVYRDDPSTEQYLLDEDGNYIFDENDEPLPAEQEREFPMYLIGARPVSRTNTGDPDTTEPAEDDLWLMTLVDKRWYWAHTTGSGQDADWEPASWTELFTALFDNCLDGTGVTITAPNALYGAPNVDRWNALNMRDLSVAYLIDDAAYRTGLRVLVRPFEVSLRQSGLTEQALATEWHQSMVEDDRFAGGGLIDDDEELAGLPSVVYDVESDGTETSVTLPTGVTGARFRARTDTITEAILTQWAGDWKQWQSPVLDAIYAGFVDMPDSAYCASAELYHDAIVGYTRISRAPHLWQPVLDCWPRGGSGQTTPDQYCAGGCGWAAKLQTTDCLHVTVECGLDDMTQELDLAWDTDAWKSGAETLTVPLNSGAVEFWIEGGQPHVSINGLELIIQCTDDAIYATGGPATGHVAASGAAACAGTTFTIKVECGCCPMAGWDGDAYYCVVSAGDTCGVDQQYCVRISVADRCTEGVTICSGPYVDEATCAASCTGAGGGIITACCTDPVPDPLYAHPINTTGTCGTLPASIPLPYDAGSGTWRQLDWGTYGVDLTLSCGSGTGIWSLASTRAFGTKTADSVTCPESGSPQINFSGFNGGAACTGTFDVRVDTTP